jgi:hypothetical protein
LLGGEGGGDDGTAERILHDEVEDDDHDDDEEEFDDREWMVARDGSISRRPAWRRPNLKWLYPFAIGATLAMGLGGAPKSEIYINLACLAHPPAVSHDTNNLFTLANTFDPIMLRPDYGVNTTIQSHYQPQINGS